MNNHILVFSTGAVHPNLICQRYLKRLLKGNTTFGSTFSKNLNDLKNLPELKPSIVVLYFQKKQITDLLLDSLETYVFNGGGLLALHAASASFKQNNRYFNLLGGRFIHHGKIAPFDVHPSKNNNGIYNGIPGFSVTDELYIHDYLKDVTVHFSTAVGNKSEPVVWTRELGKGKVAYCSLGHRAAVWQHPQVVSILNRSLDWLSKAD